MGHCCNTKCQIWPKWETLVIIQTNFPFIHIDNSFSLVLPDSHRILSFIGSTNTDYEYIACPGYDTSTCYVCGRMLRLTAEGWDCHTRKCEMEPCGGGADVYARGYLTICPVWGSQGRLLGGSESQPGRWGIPVAMLQHSQGGAFHEAYALYFFMHRWKLQYKFERSIYDNCFVFQWMPTPDCLWVAKDLDLRDSLGQWPLTLRVHRTPGACTQTQRPWQPESRVPADLRACTCLGELHKVRSRPARHGKQVRRRAWMLW